MTCDEADCTPCSLLSTIQQEHQTNFSFSGWMNKAKSGTLLMFETTDFDTSPPTPSLQKRSSAKCRQNTEVVTPGCCGDDCPGGWRITSQ